MTKKTLKQKLKDIASGLLDILVMYLIALVIGVIIALIFHTILILVK